MGLGEPCAQQLLVSPQPALPHAMATSRLGALLLSCVDLGSPGLATGSSWMSRSYIWVRTCWCQTWPGLDEPELHLGENVLVLDLAGWRRQRMPVVPRTAAFSPSAD
jgi:hypothetical protein